MVIVKSRVAACHGGNWKDGIKSWRTSSMCVRSQFIQCFFFIVFLFLFFNNREKESQPEMRGSTQHNRLFMWMWYPCCLTFCKGLQLGWHCIRINVSFPLKRSHDKISIENINTQQAHWPIYTYAYTHLLLLLLTPPLLALPHLTPTPGHRAVRVWESYF